MNKKAIWVVLCLILAAALPALAQEETKPEVAGWSTDDPPVWTSREKPPLLYTDETPAARMERNRVKEDPGTDPDPQRKWDRDGRAFQISKFPRRRALYTGQKKGWVKPMAGVNSSAEIYRETDEFVWVWFEFPDEKTAAVLSAPVREALGIATDEPAEEAPDAVEEPTFEATTFSRNESYVTLTDEARAYLTELKKEFAVTAVAPSDVTVSFEESSVGLPSRGSWRNGLDVADMNGDGLLDIVTPPQRGGNGFPVIYLGTRDGSWRAWREARWPGAYNYGTVAAGDLNGDGHADLVIGSHLMRVYAMLGDGKGTFRDASEGLPERFPTRRVALGDVDRDGDLDIVALSEGATIGDRVDPHSRLRLFVNEEGATRWRGAEVAEKGRQVGGDWMTLADFNGDGRLDVAASSVFFSGPDLVYLQRADGGWAPYGRGSLPFRSFYSSLTSGDFTGAKGKDLILSYRRSWPKQVEPGDFEAPAATDVVGLERVSWDRRGRPQRTPIVSWDAKKPIWGMASGDFDGDGHLDVVYSANTPRRLEFLLGDGKGGFRSAQAAGIDLPELTTYDIKVADVNRDGRDDILLMFEKGSITSDGSVRVWLGKGRASSGAAKAEK